jgi:hypothetical protein
MKSNHGAAAMKRNLQGNRAVSLTELAGLPLRIPGVNQLAMELFPGENLRDTSYRHRGTGG